MQRASGVLILILLDVSLGAVRTYNGTNSAERVLILILLDVSLGVATLSYYKTGLISLNPYSTGC